MPPSRSSRASAEVSAFRESLLRAVLGAARSLGGAQRGAFGRRRLINFLAGNQLPPPREDGLPPFSGHALLEGCKIDWIAELVDRLVDRGWLTLLPGRLPLIAVSAQTEEALESGARVPEDAFPVRPRLGEHPKREEKLRALRRRLARRDGRTAYTVFPNAALAALAAAAPRSLGDLALIPGFGEARIRRYGRQVLAACRH
jgi:ATP-dependent DNA helicase RecQ